MRLFDDAFATAYLHAKYRIKQSSQNILQYEKDKKAAKVLWTPAAPATKRLRHKRFPPLKGPLQLFRFLLAFRVVHTFLWLSFFPFSFGKMLFEAGRLREKKRNSIV